jgi:hypothetical protein
MATETLYATSHITGDILDPNNALGAIDNVWAGSASNNVTFTSRFAIGDPVNPLTAGFTTHSVSVRVRKSNFTTNPSVQVRLFENGVLVKTLVSTTAVSSTTGVDLSGTFTTAEISNRNDIEVEVVGTVGGGNTATRGSIQIDAITATIDTTAIPAPSAAPTLSLVSKTDTTVDLSWTTVANATTYELQRDTVTVQNTSATTFGDTGRTPETAYTYRVRGVNTSGNGPWSSELVVTTDAEVLIPSNWTEYIEATTPAEPPAGPPVPAGVIVTPNLNTLSFTGYTVSP